MSREVTLHLRPLREGDGAGPAAAWSSSTYESERRAMQELESPVEPLCGPWLARVEFTGAWGSHTPTVQAKRPPRVRGYVVRDGAVVRLPILPRTRDGLRRFGPDILRAWETADDPVAMLGWALATLCDAVWFRVKEAARVTVDDQCEAIRNAVTVDEIALSLEAQEIERRAAPFVLDARGNLVTATGEITQLVGEVIERADREIGRAILGEASTGVQLTAGVGLSARAPNLRATALAAIDRADAAETALAAANARIEGLTWESYQREAARTGGRDLLPENRDKGLNCAAMGLAGEAGEVCDLVKKVQHHRQPLDETKLRKELGDVLWYLAHACNVMGWRLDAGAFATWEARSPTGPVAWSELARLVEGVRRG